MKEVMILDKIDQVKVLADINKSTIIDCLTAGEPMTTNDISEKTGIPYHKVSYSMKKLEELEMVEVVQTKLKFGITEKYYAAAAKQFTVDLTKNTFDSEEEKESEKEKINLTYKTFLKALDKEYLKWVDSLVPDEERRGYNLFGMVYLNDEEYKKLNDELFEYVANILETYSKRKGEASRQYVIGNQFFEKK
jgi:DNA-binding transcriptional regulator GbsR (MarR family)